MPGLPQVAKVVLICTLNRCLHVSCIPIAGFAKYSQKSGYESNFYLLLSVLKEAMLVGQLSFLDGKHLLKCIMEPAKNIRNIVKGQKQKGAGD